MNKFIKKIPFVILFFIGLVACASVALAATTYTVTLIQSGSGQGHFNKTGTTLPTAAGGNASITAIPEPNSKFISWSGCVAPTGTVAGATCKLTNIRANITITAKFDLATVNTSGGSVSTDIPTDSGANLNAGSVADLVNAIIKYLTFGGGALSLAVILYAGFLFITSQGDPNKTKIAKELIIGVVAGVVLLFTAGLILKFIVPNIDWTDVEKAREQVNTL